MIVECPASFPVPTCSVYLGVQRRIPKGWKAQLNCSVLRSHLPENQRHFHPGLAEYYTAVLTVLRISERSLSGEQQGERECFCLSIRAGFALTHNLYWWIPVVIQYFVHRSENEASVAILGNTNSWLSCTIRTQYDRKCQGKIGMFHPDHIRVGWKQPYPGEA